MKQFPGCHFFEPADLGFDAQAIAASGSVTGNIIPITALMMVKSAMIYFLDAGPSTSLNLKILPVDIDGVTNLGSASVSIVTTLNPAVTEHVLIHIESGLVRTSKGNPNDNGSALLGLPYGRLVVVNADGVNAATVTVRLFLNGALK